MMFLVFAGDNYYPAGGIADLHGTYSTLEEATTEAEKYVKVPYRWAEVVEWDGSLFQTVASF